MRLAPATIVRVQVLLVLKPSVNKKHFNEITPVDVNQVICCNE